MTSTPPRRLADLYRYWGRRQQEAGFSVESLRNLYLGWGVYATQAEHVTYATVDEHDVHGIRAIPRAARRDGAILYIHGGGYVGGSSASHRKLAAHIARSAGLRALVIDRGRRGDVSVFRPRDAGGVLRRQQGLPWQPGRDRPERHDVPYPMTHRSPTRMSMRCTATPPDCRRCTSRLVATKSSWTADECSPTAHAVPEWTSSFEVIPDQQHVCQFLAGTAPEADRSISRIGQFIKTRLELT